MFFKGVIIVAGIILVVISGIVLFSYDFDESQDMVNGSKDETQKIMDVSKQFIITSPTFSYDGISDSLEIQIISLDEGSGFLVEGKFKTNHSGFGNRANLDLPEDITLHTIEMVIVEEKVISAVIDNQWDEINQITCTTASC
jgi:hypothetical protein